MKKKDKGQIWTAFSLVGTIGLTMVTTVAVGLYLGRLADNWLDTGPWATVAGVLLGMMSGAWSTYKRVIEAEREMNNE
ncbi:MAG TPA: AtpZ/AtpI family protein [Selenomonadales bacterium]|nr:AtpZ/AtpI family protein [Selenomonadales bacterium]